MLVPIVVPAALLLVWLLGFILDRMQFMQAYQEQQNMRNEMLTAVHTSVSARAKPQSPEDRANS